MAVTKEELGDLFSVVVQQLADRISEGLWSSGDMAVAVKLLKDNNISCDESNSPELQNLKDALEAKRKARLEGKTSTSIEDLQAIAKDEINKDLFH